MSTFTRFSRGQRRGYTAVELVMAVGVFAVGVTGIFAMQSATAHTNHHAKDLAVASQIAQSWQEQLAVDALKWTQTANTSTWLVAPSGAWIFPAANAAGTFGPSFTELGAYSVNNTVFCTHLRLTPLLTTLGSGMVRAEVRIFWPRHDRSGWAAGAAYAYNSCQAAALPDITPSDFHMVYDTSVVRQTVGLD